MRQNILLMALLAFGLGSALPSNAVGQEVLFAQANDKDSKKGSESDDKARDQDESEEGAEESKADENGESESAEKTSDDPAEGAAGEAKDGDEEAEASAETRIPLTANFSRTEIITASSVYVVGLGLLVAGPPLFDSPDTSMGTPGVGSLDYDISARFHGDLVSPGKFLFGAPDITGAYLLPIGGSLFYLGSAAYYWGTGDTLFGQSVNFDHSALGFVETVGWTALVTGATKHLVGRERPYKALNRPAFSDDGLDANDSNLSFFSGHSSMSFAIASYAAWDLSDHLVSDGSGFWTGRFLPFAGFYGLASLVGVSRIYDQKHYFSDVMTGALVGSLIGNLVYVTHFDSNGDPRIRHPEALEDVEVSVAPITTMSGDSGMGLVGFW